MSDTKILLKRSMVDGKVPTPSAMTEGELYVNISSALTADNFLSTVRAGKEEVIQFMDKKYNEKTFARKTDFETLQSDFEDLIQEIEDSELVIAQAYNQHNVSAGFDENGMSTLDGGVSLTEAIIELQNEWGHQGPQGPTGPAGPNFALSASDSKCYLIGVTSTTANINTSKTNANVYMQSGSLYASSDINLKTVIEEVDGNPEKIKQIPKVIFHWNDDEEKKRVLGTLAQGVEKVYPEIVTKDEDDVRGVGYDRMGVIALAGIDKLYEMIQELQRENKELRKRIEDLEK